MSLIINPPAPIINQAQRQAQQLLTMPNQIYTQTLSQWKNGMNIIWGNPANTAAILSALGVHAVELFSLSNSILTFLEANSPGCTQSTMALVKPFTANQDGTVTLNP